MEKIFLSNTDVQNLADELVIREHVTEVDSVYGIPRGGIPVAYLVAGCSGASIVDTPEEATFIVDDIIDSGKTMARYSNYKAKCAFLINGLVHPTERYIFPWERAEVINAL